MPSHSFVIEKSCDIQRTIRTELLESMFEVPASQKLSVTLTGHLDLSSPWNIGLIVGPSGSGKTLLLNELFGQPTTLEWTKRSVIDDFDSTHSMEEISRVCQSVGFNTIPSWLRPFSVLSNGEKFRVEVARLLLGSNSPVLIDEFSSVVDRQVACFASHAVQKYVRGTSRQLVAASCHYDIIDWLQPDWILEPGNPCKLTWRLLQGRPPITVSVSRVKYETWNLFREFHYMSQDLNKAARCYGLFVEQSSTGMERGFSDDGISISDDAKSNGAVRPTGRLGCSPSGGGAGGSIANECSELLHSESATQSTKAATLSSYANVPDSVERTQPRSTSTNRIASMCGVLHRPHPKVDDIVGFTRMVTLPDFQGLGLAFVLAGKVASAYKALGKRLHSYPNHPAWIRSYQRSSDWMQIKSSGQYSPTRGRTSTVAGFGERRCAVFQYIGSAMNKSEAERLIKGE